MVRRTVCHQEICQQWWDDRPPLDSNGLVHQPFPIVEKGFERTARKEALDSSFSWCLLIGQGRFLHVLIDWLTTEAAVHCEFWVLLLCPQLSVSE